MYITRSSDMQKHLVDLGGTEGLKHPSSMIGSLENTKTLKLSHNFSSDWPCTFLHPAGADPGFHEGEVLNTIVDF